MNDITKQLLNYNATEIQLSKQEKVLNLFPNDNIPTKSSILYLFMFYFWSISFVPLWGTAAVIFNSLYN